MVSFPIVGDMDNAAFVAWTTTPWTLPSNLALCINANLMYAKVGNTLSSYSAACQQATPVSWIFIVHTLLYL
jgi:isoleucyl-tRNA synthetase